MDSSATMAINPNKLLKQQFVSNLAGSSMLEILSLTTVIPVIVLFRRSIVFNYVPGFEASLKLSKKDDNVTKTAKSFSAYMSSMALDFMFILIPSLLILTVLSGWTNILALVLTLFLLIHILVKRYSTSDSKQILQTHDSIKRSISSFRVITMLLTCICILAVDFKIFPRRYAKAETYGTGWMDLGVGSFVLANAIVSRQARNIHSSGLKTVLKSTCPLILLGLGRLVSTAGVDYQVHVGEYGVHWNFFFTLAGVALLTSAINIHPKYCGIFGLLILIGYQVFLLQGLNTYLLSDVRGQDIISQNKEGVYSIFGYWGMYLVGVQMGYHLFFQKDHSTSDGLRQTRTRVFLVSLVFWLLTVVLDQYVERVSRRMCNMAYVMLVMAVNFEVLAIFMLSEYSGGSNFTVLEAAFDKNLLASFLLANVLTGLVNLSLDTLFVSSIQALVILTLYMLVLCFIMGAADFRGIRLKFW
ncbi:uncharacterized protein At4g17910 isoform X3 [Silene latifolia]|uniref:uncharacterized protein At4g17910 isoform X3 n=1 Tax=Silene latifolia TaxID=37657 RepID=UPI003D77DA33